MKNVKLAGKAGSTDQEAAEKFKKYLLSIIHELYEEQVFNADETGLFTRMLANKPM